MTHMQTLPFLLFGQNYFIVVSFFNHISLFSYPTATPGIFYFEGRCINSLTYLQTLKGSNTILVNGRKQWQVNSQGYGIIYLLHSGRPVSMLIKLCERSHNQTRIIVLQIQNRISNTISHFSDVPWNQALKFSSHNKALCKFCLSLGLFAILIHSFHALRKECLEPWSSICLPRKWTTCILWLVLSQWKE